MRANFAASGKALNLSLISVHLVLLLLELPLVIVLNCVAAELR